MFSKFYYVISNNDIDVIYSNSIFFLSTAQKGTKQKALGIWFPFQRDDLTDYTYIYACMYM